MNILDASWKILQKEYKLTKIIGQGTGGIVIKATHRIAKKDVAIKKIKCSFNQIDHMRYLLREITILRQLSQMDNCPYSPKLYDIVLPQIEKEEELIEKI